MREYEISRSTKETEIDLKINLSGGGENKISTGIDFFDHMLTSFAVHSGFCLSIKCKGDINVDCHHTVEDVGIVLGQALSYALGDKRGIARFGQSYVPMDESLSFCAVDVCGRAFLVFDAEFKRQFAGDLETAACEEFFRAFTVNAGITLHVKNLYGTNDHHKIESMFKAAARALGDAVKVVSDKILSSKGKL